MSKAGAALDVVSQVPKKVGNAVPGTTYLDKAIPMSMPLVGGGVATFLVGGFVLWYAYTNVLPMVL